MQTKLDVEIEAQLMGLYIPEGNDPFWDEKRNLLNNEVVTPEMRAVFDALLLEQAMAEAKAATPAVEEEVDREKEIADNVEVFDWYRELTRCRAPLQRQWEAVKGAKDNAWMTFLDEKPHLWKEYDEFNARLDGWLTRVTPSEKEWTIAMNRKLWYQNQAFCERQLIGKKEIARRKTWYEYIPTHCGKCKGCDQWNTTGKYLYYGEVEPAMEAVKAFWASPSGQQLNELNAYWKGVWEYMQTLNVRFSDFYSLLEEEINPYFTNGDTEEVDTMESMAQNIYETLDHLEEQHAALEDEVNGMSMNAGNLWDWREEQKVLRRAQSSKSVQPQYSEEELSALLSWADEVSNNLSDNNHFRGGEEDTETRQEV